MKSIYNEEEGESKTNNKYNKHIYIYCPKFGDTFLLY